MIYFYWSEKDPTAMLHFIKLNIGSIKFSEEWYDPILGNYSMNLKILTSSVCIALFT